MAISGKHIHRAGVTPTEAAEMDGESVGCHICAVDLPGASWQKSSWSGYHGSCVEVAELRSGMIGVRDTKDTGAGPVIVFGRADWRAFLTHVKAGL